MFEENADVMELDIIDNGNKYDMKLLSEKMESEIACFDEDGWIRRFSELGRFVL